MHSIAVATSHLHVCCKTSRYVAIYSCSCRDRCKAIGHLLPIAKCARNNTLRYTINDMKYNNKWECTRCGDTEFDCISLTHTTSNTKQRDCALCFQPVRCSCIRCVCVCSSLCHIHVHYETRCHSTDAVLVCTFHVPSHIRNVHERKRMRLTKIDKKWYDNKKKKKTSQLHNNYFLAIDWLPFGN